MLPGPFAAVLACFGSARHAWESGGASIGRAAGLSPAAAERLARTWQKIDPDAEYDKLVRSGFTGLTWDSADYPELLRHIDDPPPVLYCHGSVRREDKRAVALVGARRADDYGLKTARELAGDLAAEGVTVVSGLARGIDSAAHRGALEAGGRTIAVLGCGLDVVYPPENRRLYQEIAASGAILSEHPPGTRPVAEHFPRRNRIIAGLARVVVIVQAGERSGALITADFALQQGREVMAVPGDIHRACSAGANRLLREGAAPVLGAADVLSQMDAPWCASGGPGRAGRRPAATARPPLTDAEEKVCSQLARDPRRLEEIARRADITVGAATAALVLLEAKGVARRIPGPYYVLA